MPNEVMHARNAALVQQRASKPSMNFDLMLPRETHADSLPGEARIR